MTTSDIMFGIYLLKMVHASARPHGASRYTVHVVLTVHSARGLTHTVHPVQAVFGACCVPRLYVLQGQDPSGGLAYPMCVVLGRPACHHGPREREVACSICAAFQPRVKENRLERATRASSALTVHSARGLTHTVHPVQAVFGAHCVPRLYVLQGQDPSGGLAYPLCVVLAKAPRSHSTSPQARREKRSKQARDIMDLKAQMAQVLELLSRQAPATPDAVPGPILPQLPYPPSPRGDQGEREETSQLDQGEREKASQLAQEDTLAIAASWDTASFSSGMEVGGEPKPPAKVEPSWLGIITKAANWFYKRVGWTGKCDPAQQLFKRIGHGYLARVTDVEATDTSNPYLNYGIVVDCGSSGSRVFVYCWPRHNGNPHDLLDIKQMRDKNRKPVVMKIKPGISELAITPEKASDYIYTLLSFASQHIPKVKHKETPLYILCTAGMRILPESQQEALLEDLRTDIPVHFDFLFSDSHVEVISGKQEDDAVVEVQVPGSENQEAVIRKRTAGVLDMGGVSTQIAYEVPKTVSFASSQQVIIQTFFYFLVFGQSISFNPLFPIPLALYRNPSIPRHRDSF
ncbi:UNVERIFIED_CONTAM: hypothetical protein FKN15_068329 [Acipenser sinensis]